MKEMTGESSMIATGVDLKEQGTEADLLEMLAKLEADFKAKQKAAESAIEKSKLFLEEMYGDRDDCKTKVNDSILSTLAETIAIADKFIASEQQVGDESEEHEARDEGSAGELDRELYSLHSPAIVSPPTIIRQVSVPASVEKQPVVETGQTVTETVASELESCPEETVEAVTETLASEEESCPEETVKDLANPDETSNSTTMSTEKTNDEAMAAEGSEHVKTEQTVTESVASEEESSPEEMVEAVEKPDDVTFKTSNSTLPMEKPNDGPTAVEGGEQQLTAVASTLSSHAKNPRSTTMSTEKTNDEATAAEGSEHVETEQTVTESVASEEELSPEETVEAVEKPDDATFKTSNSTLPMEKLNDEPTAAEGGEQQLTAVASTLSSHAENPRSNCLEETLLALESKIEDCRKVLEDADSSFEEQMEATTSMTQYARSAKALMTIMV
eukprot:jgi/Psemu1/286760/fgenesh1_pg.153_\